ncbi:MAG: hypothetical protein HRJ53_07575 [Acidobacteria bacterium Pan2503]|uniref:Uncharacterized protein n=1 Tax=Candidatus Acidiferrum panamense TaxID=2741543 RepID=A0A7V8SWF2_9BACT|nr:hypothetical protein [Candidatus Acidoferrum panamensis]
MGIDVYLKWEGQTEDEEKAQYTGFSVVSGDVGYLREAYHGGPYATTVLCAECFEGNPTKTIPAITLIERLPDAIKACIERHRVRYQEEIGPDDPECKAFADFVRLAAEKEAQTGKPCTVYASY